LKTLQKQLDAANHSKTKLESLCRALQQERNDLKGKLSVYEKPGIEADDAMTAA
jgi:hypothetical protein